MTGEYYKEVMARHPPDKAMTAENNNSQKEKPRTTYAMRIENTLSYLDSMQNLAMRRDGYAPVGKAGRVSVTDIEVARFSIGQEVDSVLECTLEKARTARALVAADSHLNVVMNSLQRDLKEGRIDNFEFNEAANKTLSHCMQLRRSLSSELEDVSQRVWQSLMAINSHCKEIGLNPVFKSGVDLDVAATDIFTSYCMFADAYSKSLEQQMEKDSGRKPFILRDNPAAKAHLDVTIRAEKMAKDAAKEIQSLNEMEKKYAGVITGSYRPDVNIHVVDALPTTLGEIKPVRKRIDALNDKNGNICQISMVAYEPEAPHYDEGGNKDIYVLRDEYLRVNKDFTIMNSGDIIHEYTYGASSENWVPERFTGEQKRSLEAVGYDTAEPWKQPAEGRHALLKNGFAEGKLDPVGIIRYFKLRENLARNDDAKNFWRQEMGFAGRFSARSEKIRNGKNSDTVGNISLRG